MAKVTSSSNKQDYKNVSRKGVHSKSGSSKLKSSKNYNKRSVGQG